MGPVFSKEFELLQHDVHFVNYRPIKSEKGQTKQGLSC